ncbi:MAG: glycosyltransferase family 4 protein, partial [Chlamydiia bacterium]|nr:glycosyltransferase family 4 protein [Chlamydiia bacterium]
VIPSKIEPFGLVALEAMGVGTPVVGFRGTGIEESVVDGQTGFLVPYGEIEQLGSALIRLLSEPELCQQMGSAAQKQCQENFSLEKHIQKLEALYSEVLSAQLLHTKNG